MYGTHWNVRQLFYVHALYTYKSNFWHVYAHIYHICWFWIFKLNCYELCEALRILQMSHLAWRDPSETHQVSPSLTASALMWPARLIRKLGPAKTMRLADHLCIQTTFTDGVWEGPDFPDCEAPYGLRSDFAFTGASLKVPPLLLPLPPFGWKPQGVEFGQTHLTQVLIFRNYKL